MNLTAKNRGDLRLPRFVVLCDSFLAYTDTWADGLK